jgi:hypothetical protein
MSTLGKYCKAYPIGRLREFKGWAENAGNARKEPRPEEGKAVEVPRPLTENDILYVQENYVVTDGIFKDENLIFETVTPEWEDFCRQVLKFEVPVHEPVRPAGAVGSD